MVVCPKSASPFPYPTLDITRQFIHTYRPIDYALSTIIDPFGKVILIINR